MRHHFSWSHTHMPSFLFLPSFLPPSLPPSQGAAQGSTGEQFKRTTELQVGQPFPCCLSRQVGREGGKEDEVFDSGDGEAAVSVLVVSCFTHPFLPFLPPSLPPSCL